MNYYKARQRADGRWDFTRRNDDNIWAVGYCRPWREWGDTTKQQYPKQWEAYEASRDKHHSTGHATAEEAELCYHEYVLDTQLRDVSEQDVLRKCAECGEWTSRSLTIHRASPVPLCDAHRTREIFSKHVPPVQQITSSY